MPISSGAEAFRINAAVAKDDTQSTLMCYCEFNDIMDSIAALDADVITIETSRSDMELLEPFEEFDYPNEIGPDVMTFTRQTYRAWNGLKPTEESETHSGRASVGPEFSKTRWLSKPAHGEHGIGGAEFASG